METVSTREMVRRATEEMGVGGGYETNPRQMLFVPVGQKVQFFKEVGGGVYAPTGIAYRRLGKDEWQEIR